MRRPSLDQRDRRAATAGRRSGRRVSLGPYDSRAMTGRVFRRSASTRSARRRRGVTDRRSATRPGASTSTRPAARSSSTSVTAARRSPRVMAEQAGRLAYAHGSAFTTEPLEAYAAEVGRAPAGRRPGDLPGVAAARRRSRPPSSWPAPTTSPAASRTAGVVIARWGSYHGNTLGALDLSGRPPLRRPYEALARAGSGTSRPPTRTAPASPAAHALGDADELAAELERGDRRRRGRGRSRPSSPSRSSARRSRAAVPPDDYWPAIAEVCRRHGVLLDRRRGDDRVRADGTLVRARPLGRPAGHPRRGQGRDVRLLAVRVRRGVRRPVHDDGHWPGAGFVHGFTYSHAPVGAAVAREVLRILDDEDLVAASARQGRAAPGAARTSGSTTTRRRRDPRPRPDGRASSSSRTGRPAAPFPRARTRRRRRVVRAARDRGVLVYSGTGNAERRRRRHDPARAAVRRHRRRAGCGSPTRSAPRSRTRTAGSSSGRRLPSAAERLGPVRGSRRGAGPRSRR